MNLVKIGQAVALLALLLLGCGPLGWGIGWNGPVTGVYASNGERIYETGTSANGRISYSDVDFGSGMMGRGGMMGGRLACIDCHGPDGRGGEHVMHMTVMEAPDIRWSTLTEAGHGDHSSGEDEHAEAEETHGAETEMEHPAYTEETFVRAVTEGVDPAGEPLDPVMPRWQMSQQDLADLMAYLKTLS